MRPFILEAAAAAVTVAALISVALLALSVLFPCWLAIFAPECTEIDLAPLRPLDD